MPHERADRLSGQDAIQEEARADLLALRGALLADPGSREVYRSLFPDGLTFEALEIAPRRRVWALSGRAQLGPQTMATPTGFEPVSPA